MSDFWDAHTAAWLAGEDPLTGNLSRWFRSYEGTGRGAVTRDGFVEPYQGDLLGREGQPRVVILGLNPGQYFPDLQSRQGLFAAEIKQAGSYSAWVRDHPYDNKTWLARHRPNRYYLARLGFTHRWLCDPAATYNAMLIFEMYPWHSTGLTGHIHPPPDVIDQFVWQPIRETGIEHVFAFGAPWARLARLLDLQVLDVLGRGGRDYGSDVASRTVTLFALPGGQTLVAESQTFGLRDMETREPKVDPRPRASDDRRPGAAAASLPRPETMTPVSAVPNGAASSIGRAAGQPGCVGDLVQVCCGRAGSRTANRSPRRHHPRQRSYGRAGPARTPGRKWSSWSGRSCIASACPPGRPSRAAGAGGGAAVAVR